ncbi:MAG TPA: ABC transporter permease [Verrucomicrobiae bacterium]|nr:ABC transporter permease [Verrucomicrobiae bacterium]
MTLPFSYNARNVVVRWRSSAATVLIIALVVAVCLILQAMAQGIVSSTSATGDPANVIIVRKGSTAESSSIVTRTQARRIQFLPQVQRDERGDPISSAEVVVLANLRRRGGAGEANVSLRGISPAGRALRPQVRLAEGRWFVPGKREVVVSRRLAPRFEGLGLNERFKSGAHSLAVVGIFDAVGTAFESEIWLDANEARSLFDREQFSSVIVRVPSPADQQAMKKSLESDKQLRLLALPEPEYYAKLTKSAGPIRFLGYFLAATLSVGAVFAAMNAMYAIVGRRTREVGTLRILGYPRRIIMLGFLMEGGLLALAGGALGCALAAPFNWVTTSTISFDSFSEIVFKFHITPWLIIQALAFSFAIGVAGSFLPALRVSRLPVIAAVKAV